MNQRASEKVCPWGGVVCVGLCVLVAIDFALDFQITCVLWPDATQTQWQNMKGQQKDHQLTLVLRPVQSLTLTRLSILRYCSVLVFEPLISNVLKQQ